MKKGKAIVLLVAIWTAALLSAAGAYALHHRPLVPHPEPRVVAVEALPMPAQRAAPSDNTWVTIAPVTIVGNPPVRLAPKKAVVKKHCSRWIGLTQGPRSEEHTS